MAVFDFMKRRAQESGGDSHNPAAALAAMLAALDLASEPVPAVAPHLTRKAHPDRPAQRDRAVFIGGASRM